MIVKTNPQGTSRRRLSSGSSVTQPVQWSVVLCSSDHAHDDGADDNGDNCAAADADYDGGDDNDNDDDGDDDDNDNDLNTWLTQKVSTTISR